MALQDVRTEDHEKVIENFVNELTVQNHFVFFEKIENRLKNLLEEQMQTPPSPLFIKEGETIIDAQVIEKLNNYAKEHQLDKHINGEHGIIWQNE